LGLLEELELLLLGVLEELEELLLEIEGRTWKMEVVLGYTIIVPVPDVVAV
jgi:hypothetical protein